MKRVLSILILIFILASSVSVLSADVYIELNPLEYDEYMRGETLFISGQSNVYTTLGLYPPEGSAIFIMTYAPDELSDGIEIETGTDESKWPDGVWTIVVQYGDVSEVLEFTLSETVDRSEDDGEYGDSYYPDDDNDTSSKPDKKPSGNTTVTSIIPEKTKVSLTEGESTKVQIDTSASSLSVEVDDEDVIKASMSGKTLNITALKRGESQLWVKTGSNYASIKVTVTAAPVKEEEPTEEITEPTVEEPTAEILENPFRDIESHWAKDSIVNLYSKGIVNGMDSDTFAPDSFVTRAQFVTMLAKAFNLKSTSSESPFNDVSENSWYFTSVMSAYENKIAQGDYEGNFNPDSLVTRQDMATLAYRAAKAAGIAFENGESAQFSDHDSIKDYAVEAVYSMRSKGIINGMTDTTFEPLGNATRAQAAHIIYKLVSLK